MVRLRSGYGLGLALWVAAGGTTGWTQDLEPVAAAIRDYSGESDDPSQASGTPQAQGSQPAQGQASPIEQRGNLHDEQTPAPRPENLTLDPKYRGFFPIPNTPVLIKFNAKPRVDLTVDNRNSGDDTRFVTATIPVSTDPTHGGGDVFNINAKATNLSLEVTAPTVDGAPRFFYQNDFFGSGGGEFPYRIKQLYGEYYDIIVGMTFSVFEDPDVWPDTVDYEGPNAMIFARRPLARYLLHLNEEWQLNFGLEQPQSEIDTSIDPAAQSVNHAPDVGMNARWEDAKVGHVQLAVILRELSVRGPIVGDQNTFGWGFNLSTDLDVTASDSIQAQLTYGHGVFRYCNDNFSNNDAAFNSRGELKPIPYFGAMMGYTHQWSDQWRSTATYGYVHLENLASQEPTAYHYTNYASVNIIWQLHKRLSIGLEGLYGAKVDKAENTGDVFRVQIGLVYSLFD